MSKSIKTFLVFWIICAAFWCSSIAARADGYSFVSLEYAPYACCQNGTLKGWDIDIMQECFRRMNEKLDMTLVPWKRALYMGMNGHADGLIGILKVPAREQKMYFSTPIRGETISFFVRQDSDIVFDGDLSNMGKLRFGVVSDYSYGKEVENFLKTKVSADRVEKAVSPDMNVAKLFKGRFDILIGDTASTIHTIRTMGLTGQVRRLYPPVSFNNVYAAFSKKRKLGHLRDRFNVALESMRKDGTLHHIMKKYMDSQVIEKENIIHAVEKITQQAENR
ncbi:ABC transporter substrate-binding protein [Desulfovibrio sp. JC010]|uniref:substrate-binding periplasmic protein n=1 Tax=Desulfovibrio sp. JC010 TaxID=2593641 RepID=UPI0013D73947|nr:transporter substrate-binding domain-containing protein [Desulfovibrio sp. JC010]NDV26477.1 transporter substrate-binding domain-containing protein [Desulfovibrio sp. JC010]